MNTAVIVWGKRQKHKITLYIKLLHLKTINNTLNWPSTSAMSIYKASASSFMLRGRSSVVFCLPTGYLIGKLVANNLSPLYLHLLVQPFPVTAALHTALPRATLGTWVEATHAVYIQTVTQIPPTWDQQAFVVIHFTLERQGLSVGTRKVWVCVSSTFFFFFF